METPAFRQITSWEAAEVNARDWMRAWGFTDAHLTPPGADAGLDVRSRNAVAQVKYEARDVGRPYLQLLVGARGRQQGARMLFFTGSKYTEQAIAYANEMDIALFHYRLDGAMQAVNKPAADLITRSEKSSQQAASQNVPLRAISSSIHTVGFSLLVLASLMIVGQLFLPGNQRPLTGAALALLALGTLALYWSKRSAP